MYMTGFARETYGAHRVHTTASMAATLCVAGPSEVVTKGLRRPFAALEALMEKERDSVLVSKGVALAPRS